MRRVLQLVTLLAIATPGVLLAGSGIAQASPGSAKNVKPGVLQSAWYWENAVEQGQPPVAPGQLPATEPSGVPSGDLAVANTNNDGSSSKMTALAFSLGAAAKPHTTITAFTFAVTLDTSPSAGNVGAASAPVVACLPTRLWAPAQGGDYTNEPTVDCSTKIKPTIKGNTFTFAIPAIAQDWVDDQNVGVALVNDPANTSTPFQAVFTGAKTVKATMTFQPPLAVPASGGSYGTGATSGAGSATGTGNSSTGTGTTSTPAGAGSVPSGPVNLPPSGPTTTTTTPGGATSPQVAPPNAPTLPATTPAGLAAARHPAPSAPNTAFWVAAAALALLVIGAALVLADDQVPVPTAVTTKLGLVLRERQRQRERESERESERSLVHPVPRLSEIR